MTPPRAARLLAALSGAAMWIADPVAAQTAASSTPVTPDMVQTGSDIPKDWQSPEAGFDYVKREVMIPMRDGVPLHTVIVMLKTAAGLPILLERTPYDASGFVRGTTAHLIDVVAGMSREWVRDGYILVWQDVRGKYGSKGDYVMTRPPRGPLNPTTTDDTTDAYDTIDWLVKNLPQSNGRVGMIGSSYDGWTVTMALLGPHPALKVAAPESPMIDGWMGDDWFHYGAFRQPNIDYFTGQTRAAGAGAIALREGRDDYQNYLDAGSAGAFAAAAGLDQLPWWKRLTAHPAYDALWQGQALDKSVAARPSAVPTLWLEGLWDQEDIYGAVHAWERLKTSGHGANNYLVIGPWYHSQVAGNGEALGPFHWKGDTAADFRREMLVPFFDTYLKDRPATHPMAPVTIYNPVENHWDRFTDWPGAAPDRLTPLYLQPGLALSFTKPAATGAAASDSYVADPAKPVPFIQVPIDLNDRSRWSPWLVQDQRFVANRTDVLSYQTPVLDQPVRLEGAPIADIYARTSGTDGDVVVKLIDVYPPRVADHPELSGYQLPIALDIFRGRYRNSFEHPSAIPAGRVQEYRFRLPTTNYVFLAGHRIMVQIQSSLFPVYDRNPQTYVPNVFFAKAEDYRKATVTVEHGSAAASAVLLPIVPASTALPPAP